MKGFKTLTLALLLAAAPAFAHAQVFNPKCDLNDDNKFNVTDVLVLLQEVVNITNDICVLEEVPVEIVWMGPDAGAMSVDVTYDGTGFVGAGAAVDCKAGSGFFSSENDIEAESVLRLAAVALDPIVTGTVMWTCHLEVGQLLEGLVPTLVEATDIELQPIVGTVEIRVLGG